jgi:HAD superfamily hydrolase (TIGR01509 family)
MIGGLPAAVDAVVFDLDGTLVDSKLDFAAMRAETGCPEGTGLLEFQAGLADAQERQQVQAVIHRHEMSGAAAASWMPGAQELLRQLTQRGLPVGIFTRNSRESSMHVLARLGTPCDDLVAREDAPAKPDPTGLRLLAERWQLSAERLLMIGDFRYDLEAARNAGVMACLYDPNRDSPFTGLADIVIHHFEQFMGPQV